MINVLIADDHSAVRKRVIQLLQDDMGEICIAEVADSPALVEKAMSGDWDIIISDLVMPGGNGIDAVKKICTHLPSQRILILSINDEDKYSGHAKLAGASGYLNKTNVTEELVNAVKVILEGKQYFPAL